jgi:hypothetical protein
MLWVVELLSHQPHLKSKIQSEGDFDSVSDEEGQEDTPAHQVLGTMHLGSLPWPRYYLLLQESPTGCLAGGL